MYGFPVLLHMFSPMAKWPKWISWRTEKKAARQFARNSDHSQDRVARDEAMRHIFVTQQLKNERNFMRSTLRKRLRDAEDLSSMADIRAGAKSLAATRYPVRTHGANTWVSPGGRDKFRHVITNDVFFKLEKITEVRCRKKVLPNPR
jgi:hypothetical protein